MTNNFKKTPTILNVDLTAANTQYSFVLPEYCVAYTVKLRDAAKTFRLAYVTGKVATPTAPYLSLAAGKEHTVDGLWLQGKAEGDRTVFIASPDASQVAEVEMWS